MKYNIAICDDDSKTLEMMKQYVEHFYFINDYSYSIRLYKNGTTLLDDTLKGDIFHIIFIDIEMPQSNGISIVSYIKNKSKNHPYIIFVSNYPQYMKDSFSVHPYYFIQKPVSEKIISDLLSEITNEMSSNEHYITLIDTDNHKELINLSDIIFITVNDSKKQLLDFHSSLKTITARGLITEWEERLNPFGFIATHRTYLVNLEHIHIIDHTSITMDDGSCILLSRKKYQLIKDTYVNNIIRINHRKSERM